MTKTPRKERSDKGSIRGVTPSPPITAAEEIERIIKRYPVSDEASNEYIDPCKYFYYYAVDCETGQKYPIIMVHDSCSMMKIGQYQAYETGYYDLVATEIELTKSKDPSIRYDMDICMIPPSFPYFKAHELKQLCSRLLCDVQKNSKERRKWFSVKTHLCSKCGIMLDINEIGRYYACGKCGYSGSTFFHGQEYDEIADLLKAPPIPRRSVLVSPYGVLVEVSDVDAFCKKYKLDTSLIILLINGSKPEHDGWTNYGNKAREKYYVIEPDGEEVCVVSVGQYCKNRGLNYVQFAQLLSGKRAAYKGYVINADKKTRE